MNLERTSLRRQVGQVTAAAVVVTIALFVLVASTAKASFSDSETLGPNTVTAARLDLDIGDSTTPFTVSNLAPGDRVQTELELRNAGSLPLRASLDVTTDNGILGDDLFAIVADQPCSALVSSEDGAPLNDVATARSVLLTIDLAATESATVCVDLFLPVDSPNELQGTSVAFDLVFNAEHLLEDADEDSA